MTSEREPSTSMTAAHFAEYGAPDVVRSATRPRPTIVRPDDILVRTRAAALHIGDCFVVRGRPLLVRSMSGWTRPKKGVPGFDVAGVVEAVGEAVTRFQPGDEVFGGCDQGGACAEFVAWPEKQFAKKPSRLTFEEAASMPTSGLAALHALRDTGRLGTDSSSSEQTILINGASGGIGTFAVQIAKIYGAEVTGVCSAANRELVESLGADRVIDYTEEDFTTEGERYDVIFDNVENRSLAEVRRALKPRGTLILNSGTGASGLAFVVRLLRPLLLSPFSKQRLCRYLSVPNGKDLDQLSEWVESGRLTPMIDRVVPFAEVAKALHHLETGRGRGKVVVAGP